MPKHSCGLDVAWQIAAGEAKASGHEFIEPEHLFIGVCKVGHQWNIDQTAVWKIGSEEAASFQAESEAVRALFEEFRIDRVFVYREVRQLKGKGHCVRQGGTVSRSDAGRRAFDRARGLATRQSVLTCFHLLAALLQEPVEVVANVLRREGVDPAAVQKRALTYRTEQNSSRHVEAKEASPRDERLEVAAAVDARASHPFTQSTEMSVMASRLALLYSMPLKFAEQPRLDGLLQTIVEETVQAIPGAIRGSVLLKDRIGGKMLLKGHVAENDGPVISETLVRRAMTEAQGFIWERSEAVEIPRSIERRRIQTGMYAPLIWQKQALGVLCIDNPQRSSVFEEEDLQLLVAVANYAAMAVANYYSDEDLRKHSDFTSRLICSRFPPQLRTKLMQLASTGALPLGTRQSLVTVLISDIRGFTELSAKIGPQRMTDLLNEYFPPLLEAIFSFNGSIERFVGDAIFAVFGSPEPDDKQQENAIRAAFSMQEVIRRLNEGRTARNLAACEIGIGIDCGEVLHGFIGNAERLEFTVVGDAANFASRYCNVAKPGEILISPEVHSRVWNLVVAEKTKVPTKHEGDLTAHRVKELKS